MQPAVSRGSSFMYEQPLKSVEQHWCHWDNKKKANDEILFWQTTCHLWRVVGWESVTKRILQWSSWAHTLKCSLQKESFRRAFRREMLWKVNASMGLSDCVRYSFCPNFETETINSDSRVIWLFVKTFDEPLPFQPTTKFCSWILVLQKDLTSTVPWTLLIITWSSEMGTFVDFPEPWPV